MEEDKTFVEKTVKPVNYLLQVWEKFILSSCAKLANKFGTEMELEVPKYIKKQ